MFNIKSIVPLFLFFTVLISAQPVKKYSGEVKKSVGEEVKVVDVKSIDKNKDGKVFQCPMDWDVIKDKSGICEKCKMDLKEYDVKKAEENLNKFLKAKEKSKVHNHSKSMDKMESQTSVIWNELCPLDGEKINKNGVKSSFKGKTIAFCCDECKAEFDKQPEKYMKNLSKDGKKFLAKK
ncbi:MAG: hypothetical protein Fur0015_10630 [Ignavibacteriales bacterium]